MEVDTMNIYEAVTAAFERNKCITNPDHYGSTKIRPTNGAGNCVLSMWDGSNPTKRGWQPRAKDFLRTDWMIVD